jgi:hypothetical protein
MQKEHEYTGRCFCGAVEMRVTGEPAAMGYCHCDSCRSWSAAPLNGFTLWAPSAVTITRGAEHVGAFSKTSFSVRKWCTKCGGHLLTEHPTVSLVDVYAATIPELTFKPMLHVNYENTVLHLHDGLPKQKDFPAELGGSGQLLAD